MKKLRLKKYAKKNLFIHNDIANTARRFRKRVEEMAATGKGEGIALEITGCLVLLAFTFEARLNFIGSHKVTEWKERKPFDKKLKVVLETLGLDPDQTVRPYSSIQQLKDFRDTIAHGQPTIIEMDVIVEAEQGEDHAYLDLRAPWENFLTPDFMLQCSDDIDAIWKEWLATAGIEVHQTLTHGEVSVTLLEGPVAVG